MATIHLGFHLLCVSIWATVVSGNDFRKVQSFLRLSRGCGTPMVRLDQYDRVELRSSFYPTEPAIIPVNLTCTAHFMTGNTDQGVCIENQDLFFKSPKAGVQLKVYTSRFGPDKAFDYYHMDPNFMEWCTRESIVSIELSSTREFQDFGDDYNLRFLVKNVSRESIDKRYRMDSFKDCNLTHVLKSGEAIQVYGQEYPTRSDLPSSCQLTFSTKSEEEYEEVCVKILEHRTPDNCLSRLEISGFNSRFWPASEVLGCNDTHSELRAGHEMCSLGKTLTLNLTRTNVTKTGLIFTAEVKVKWHPHWHIISQEKSELRVLDFVKGVTYFVAAIDSLAGIAAAILTYMFKRPRSFWKTWAETVKIPNMCEPVHYEDSCTAVSSSKNEDVMEVKSY